MNDTSIQTGSSHHSGYPQRKLYGHLCLQQQIRIYKREYVAPAAHTAFRISRSFRSAIHSCFP